MEVAASCSSRRFCALLTRGSPPSELTAARLVAPARCSGREVNGPRPSPASAQPQAGCAAAEPGSGLEGRAFQQDPPLLRAALRVTKRWQPEQTRIYRPPSLAWGLPVPETAGAPSWIIELSRRPKERCRVVPRKRTRASPSSLRGLWPSSARSQVSELSL